MNKKKEENRRIAYDTSTEKWEVLPSKIKSTVVFVVTVIITIGALQIVDIGISLLRIKLGL